MSCNNCNGNCEECTDKDCGCQAGLDAPQPRHGNGAPSVQADDRAGRLYYEDDTTPAGEVWFFDGTTWTDLGYSLQGDTGATGASGGSIIYNNPSGASTSGTGSYETLDMFTDTGTISTNGDQFQITTRYSFIPSTDSKGVKLIVSGNTLAVFEIGMTAEAFFQIDSTVTRINATTISALTTMKIFDSFNNQVGVTNSVWSASLGVADSSILTITAQGKSFTTAGDVTSDFLTVEFKHKT